MNKDIDTTLYLEHDFTWSFKDFELKYPKEWREVLVSNDEQRLEEFLQCIGADIEYGWRIESCEHYSRSTPNIRHFGPLIRFKQRTDKWWMDNYMEVEDIARLHKSSFVRSGMRESLNTGLSLGQLVEEQYATHKKYLENLKAAEEACECKENKGK